MDVSTTDSSMISSDTSSLDGAPLGQALLMPTQDREVSDALVHGKRRPDLELLREAQDPLTGAYNRTVFNIALATWVQSRQPFDLALLNLRQLQLYNLQRGHACGDILLSQVAQIAKQHLPEGANLYRVKGGEFGMLSPRAFSNMSETLDCIRQIQQSIAQLALPPFARPKVSNRAVAVQNCTVQKAELSVGVARFPHDGFTAALMLEMADRALYMTQVLCPGHLTVYEPHGFEFVESFQTAHRG